VDHCEHLIAGIEQVLDLRVVTPSGRYEDGKVARMCSFQERSDAEREAGLRG
jgi:hypothetical protein